MNFLILAAPVFLLLEIVQLTVAERYVGIKQIARGVDPRTLGPGEWLAALWSLTLIAYWLWMIALLVPAFGRVHGLALLLVTAVAFTIRRNCRLTWVLVVLTIEGAVRIGILGSLCVLAWRRL